MYSIANNARKADLLHHLKPEFYLNNNQKQISYVRRITLPIHHKCWFGKQSLLIAKVRETETFWTEIAEHKQALIYENLRYEILFIRTIVMTLGLSSKREYADPKSLPNKNKNVQTKSETKECNVSRPIHINFFSGMGLLEVSFSFLIILRSFTRILLHNRISNDHSIIQTVPDAYISLRVIKLVTSRLSQ
jgi:hypothetical protein